MNGGKISDVYSSILKGLRKVEGVKMIALGSRDGFLISKYESDESESLTLMAATMIRAAETAANKLDRVNLNRMIVDFSGKKIIAAPAGPKVVISVMAAENANVDPIIRELDQTLDRIKDII